jgi:lysophospholipase L1-like esterase
MIGFASCSIKQKPNIVLIHVGTNDCTGAGDDDAGRANIADAENRLRNLVNYVFEQSDGVTIILSTLLPNAKPLGNTYVDIVNEGIRRIATDSNRKIQLAEMSKDWSE